MRAKTASGCQGWHTEGCFGFGSAPQPATRRRSPIPKKRRCPSSEGNAAIHLRRIRMKWTLIAGVALAALVALPAPDWAQAKMDFSGSWTFDASKSDAAAAAGRRGGGGGRMGGGGPAAA